MKRRFSLVLVVAMIQLVSVSTSFADPIHVAAQTGNAEEVTRLISLDPAKLEVHDEYGWSPLHWAARNGHTAVVQALIAFGADTNARNRNGHTPLYLATMHRRATTVAALQPEAIALVYTQTALSHTDAGNLARAAESHTQHAHAQAAAGDFASAVEAHHLAHATHTALGNHGLAGLSHRLATLLALAVPVKDLLASASGLVQTMETHFETAVTKASEIQFHRARGDEPAALAEAQLQESLSAAELSEARAISAFEAAITALDGALEGAMRACNEAQVADGPAAHLAQYAAEVASLRAHIEGVSRKLEETLASATARHERVWFKSGLGRRGREID